MSRSLLDVSPIPRDALRGTRGLVTAIGAGGAVADLMIGGSLVPDVPIAAPARAGQDAEVAVGDVALVFQVGSGWLVMSRLNPVDYAKAELLVRNGDFETRPASNGLNPPYAWDTSLGVNGGATIGLVTSPVAGGSYALQGRVHKGREQLCIAESPFPGNGTWCYFKLKARASATLGAGEHLRLDLAIVPTRDSTFLDSLYTFSWPFRSIDASGNPTSDYADEIVPAAGAWTTFESEPIGFDDSYWVYAALVFSALSFTGTDAGRTITVDDFEARFTDPISG